MTCEKHSWWFDAPCPGCIATYSVAQEEEHDMVQGDDDAGVPVHDAVGASDDNGYTEPPLPVEDPEDPLAIPAFLRLRPNGEWMYPSLHNGEPRERRVWSGPAALRTVVSDSVSPMDTKRRLADLTDEALLTLISSSDITLYDRQPLIMEARRREDRKKAYERLDKAKFLKKEK